MAMYVRASFHQDVSFFYDGLCTSADHATQTLLANRVYRFLSDKAYYFLLQFDGCCYIRNLLITVVIRLLLAVQKLWINHGNVQWLN